MRGSLHPWRESLAAHGRLEHCGAGLPRTGVCKVPRGSRPTARAPSPCMTPLTVMTRPRTQEFLVIEGGVPLTGTIRPEGNKNSALALLAATLLTAEPVVLGNMPRIRDVETMLELLVDLGAEVELDRPQRGARVRRRRPLDDARRGALGAHPRLDPARRAAARALRQRRRAAAGRRRHRPPARRLPPLRARGARRRGDGRPHLSLPRPGRAQGRRVPPRRGLGHRHRERAHGRGPGRRPDDDPPRGLRAARAGPLPPARRHGRRDRGHRLEPAARARPARARRRLARRLPRSHRGRLVHRHGRGHGRRRHDHRLRAQRPARDAARVQAPRRARRDRRARRARAARAGADASRTTRTTRSPRSTTGPGRRSRPT